MIRRLSTSDPYGLLCIDLYSLDIFDRAINGLLSIIRKDNQQRTILVERSFLNSLKERTGAGFYFIQCLNSPCEEEHLRQFRSFLESIVNDYAHSNYMEVDPILIAPSYSDEVISFVEQYNKIQRRKPIELFQYGE